MRAAGGRAAAAGAAVPCRPSTAASRPCRHAATRPEADRRPSSCASVCSTVRGRARRGRPPARPRRGPGARRGGPADGKADALHAARAARAACADGALAGRLADGGALFYLASLLASPSAEVAQEAKAPHRDVRHLGRRCARSSSTWPTRPPLRALLSNASPRRDAAALVLALLDSLAAAERARARAPRRRRRRASSHALARGGGVGRRMLGRRRRDGRGRGARRDAPSASSTRWRTSTCRRCRMGCARRARRRRSSPSSAPPT